MQQCGLYQVVDESWRRPSKENSLSRPFGPGTGRRVLELEAWVEVVLWCEEPSHFGGLAHTEDC